MAFIDIIDIVYPVGAAYMSTTSTSPATLFGGTWSEVKNALLSTIGYGGATAGQYSGNNTMTEKQMPAHEHDIRRKRIGSYEDDVDFQNSNVGNGSGWFILSGAVNSGVRAYATATGGGATLLPIQLFPLLLGANRLASFFKAVM